MVRNVTNLARSLALALGPVALLAAGAASARADAAADALLSPTSPRVDGYATPASLVPGASLSLRASVAPPSRYRIQILRLGGRGARLMACRPGCSRDLRGTRRRTGRPDSRTGLLDAGWPVSASLRVPATWPGGYYVARFLVTRGPGAGASRPFPFIVRERAGRRAPILVVVPVNTWQAYNPWGGRSLYDFNSRPTAATAVSFRRPYSTLWNLVEYDVPLLRFLERNRYRVGFATDRDVDRDPALLSGRSLVMTAGHGEYWTARERRAFDDARTRGTNLAFMGSDTGTAQIHYAAGRDTLVRDSVEPPPPCALRGVQYVEGLTRAGDPPRAYTVTAPAGDPWLRGTGLRPGDSLGDLVGHEWDSLVPGCVSPEPTSLFHYEGRGTSPSGTPNGDADAVRFLAASGSVVFSTGSLQFVWGLDAWGARAVGAPRRQADPRLQRFMRNALAGLAPGARASP